MAAKNRRLSASRSKGLFLKINSGKYLMLRASSKEISRDKTVWDIVGGRIHSRDFIN